MHLTNFFSYKVYVRSVSSVHKTSIFRHFDQPLNNSTFRAVAQERHVLPYHGTQRISLVDLHAFSIWRHIILQKNFANPSQPQLTNIGKGHMRKQFQNEGMLETIHIFRRIELREDRRPHFTIPTTRSVG